MEDNDKTKNQSLIIERDGITQDRIAWPEKVIMALQPCGTEKAGLWFTHRAIQKRLQDHAGGCPDNLAQVLYTLVKSGHIERAIKPEKIKAQYAPRHEYIYRRTGKAFKPGKPVMQQGFDVWVKYKRFPKWLRDMMT